MLPDQHIRMKRDSLDDMPSFALPQGYSIATYQAGDSKHWRDIHIEADKLNTFSENLFREQFGDDDGLISQRQYYLINPVGEKVGTGSAWFTDNSVVTNGGMVHWVAIHPAEQGKGLAKPLISTICHRFKELGHTSAYLDTSTARVPAVNLYLKFGFEPIIDSDEDAQRWEMIKAYLKYNTT